MKDQDITWLNERPHIFGNVKLTREETQRIYDIYNSITGENKKTSSCGRCVYNVKKRVLVEYERIQNLQG